VENVIFEHPGVEDVAVIGVPHDHWGEAVHAVVVRRAGQDISSAELIDYCRESLAAYKVPKSVEFRAELPRTTSGKIRRNQLRSEHGS
jgi:acyl-CoA synthetase (AMP-forming)/AMP-acid ligase II